VSPKKKNEPIEAEVVNENPTKKEKIRKGNRFYLSLIFILLGALFIVENFFPNMNVWRNFWPLILVLLGLSLIAKSIRE
jgi:uncharacterized integral membrane protein